MVMMAHLYYANHLYSASSLKQQSVPMQSVHITTDVVGLNLKKVEVYNIM
jgi:hypothetical protein